MSAELPIPPAFRVTNKAVHVGDPKQLVDLLTSEVAAPILEIARTKNNMPLYKCKLRCKTLFQGNLDVYFLLDYPNQALKMEDAPLEGKAPEVVVRLPTEHAAPCLEFQAVLHADRAEKYAMNLELALNFWALLMEAEVKRVFPDKTPIQVDQLAREGVLSLRTNPFSNKPFELASFLGECNKKQGTPCFKVGYGWIASKEDPRSEEHLWGFKFDLSPYPQFPATVRSRKPAESAAKKQETLLKKRKVADDEEEKVEAVAETVA